MSFRDMRASRSARQARSFVKPSTNAGATPSTTGDPTSQEDIQSRQPCTSLQTYHIPAPGPSSSGTWDEAAATAVSYSPNQVPVNVIPIPSGWYTNLPAFVSVRQTKERGRGLWTSTDVPAGSVILAVKPHVHTLSRSQLHLYCTSCCAPQPATGFKKCSKCKTIYYCGTACQNSDWQLHKLECEALQKWAATAPLDANGANYSVPPEAVRCLARIIWRREKLGSSSIWWKELEAMQSKRDGLAQSMVDTQVHLAHAVVRYIGVSGPEELQSVGIHSISELVDLISKFTLNSFTLTTPSVSPIGVALAPLPGLLNHTCDPNAAVVFPRVSKREPELQVVAIRDIPANSELFTSYIDTTLPTSHRRKELKETYNFTCSCAVCALPPDKSLEDWREKMWCPNSCGGSCLLPVGGDDVVRCPKCHASTKDIGEILDLMHTGQQALDKATGLQSSDPEAALRLVQNMVRTLSTRLPPSAHPLLALTRLGQNLLISQLAREITQTVLETSVQFAMAYVKGLSSILRPGHPVRAVSIAELGKLLAVDEPAPCPPDVPVISPLNDKAPIESAKGVLDLQVSRGAARLRRAVEVLRQAHVELLIAFGKTNDGGEVGKSVREMLVNLEKELGVWTSGIRDALEDTVAEQKAKRLRTDQGH